MRWVITFDWLLNLVEGATPVWVKIHICSIIRQCVLKEENVTIYRQFHWMILHPHDHYPCHFPKSFCFSWLVSSYHFLAFRRIFLTFSRFSWDVAVINTWILVRARKSRAHYTYCYKLPYDSTLKFHFLKNILRNLSSQADLSLYMGVVSIYRKTKPESRFEGKSKSLF